MNFSDKLRELRKSRDIKQEVFAEAMNVSRQTVSKWENGTAMPDLKKLTAIANYFEVTIDELLGFSNGENGGINDYTKEYVNELISLENEECTRKINEVNKKLKICVIVLSAAVIFATVTALSQNGKINSLQSQINNVQNNIQNGQYIQTDDDSSDDHGIEYDVNTEILSVDKEKPWLANVRFAYSPETYSNSLKVTVEIPQENGKTKSLELENKNGKFVLETQVDASILGDYTLLAKDDTNTMTTDVTPYFIGQYFDTSVFISSLDYKNGKILYNDGNGDSITFDVRSKVKLKNGYLKIYGKGSEKPLYEKDCRINSNCLELGQFKFDCNSDLYSNLDGYLNFEISAEDENGIKYICYVDVNVNTSHDTGDETCEAIQYKVEFPNGKAIINNTDNY